MPDAPAERGKSSAVPEALTINGDHGRYVLAADEAAAQEYAREQWGEATLADVGWMHETGWDQDLYESREDFEAESGFTSWWSGCVVPEGTVARDGLMRAWEVGFA